MEPVNNPLQGFQRHVLIGYFKITVYVSGTNTAQEAMSPMFFILRVGLARATYQSPELSCALESSFSVITVSLASRSAAATEISIPLSV